METGQLLERFRLLSRDIQNGLQSSQKQIEALKSNPCKSEADRLAVTIGQISEAWQDFSGWILVSTLEDLDEARANCTPGRVDIMSKVTRSKLRRKNDLSRMGIKIDSTGVEQIVIETFIPYFEQLLDLLFSNAIKYSPKAGEIEVTCSRSARGVSMTIRSIGPYVSKNESSQLGEKGFRSENALKTELSGQGYGLFNCRRLSDLLGVDLEFHPDQRILYTSGHISYANFNVLLRIPDTPPQTHT